MVQVRLWGALAYGERLPTMASLTTNPSKEAYRHPCLEGCTFLQVSYCSNPKCFYALVGWRFYALAGTIGR